MKRLALLLALSVPVLLGGCQTIKAHNPFRHRTPDYQSARQERPLEMPPGLNQPPTSQALVIPAAGTPAAKPVVNAKDQPPPALQPTVDTATTSRTLDLSDTPASAYHRVGLALARAGVGKVTAHDDTARTYEVAVDSVVKTKPEGGFFHRLVHRSHQETVRGAVAVSVLASGTGSVVTAHGHAAAVARVMSALQTRLK